MGSVVQWWILFVLEDSSHVNFGTSVADSVRLVLHFKDFIAGIFFFSVRTLHTSFPKEVWPNRFSAPLGPHFAHTHTS